MRLLNKTAIITGAARGIGLATAQLFIQEGASVLAVDMEEECLNNSFKDVEKNLKTHRCDVTNVAHCEEMVKKAIHCFNKIDIIINNAGTTGDAFIHKMNDTQWNSIMEVNVKGCFNVCRAASPYMRTENHNGSIVNISSISSQIGTPGQANYSAAKAAVIGFTRTLAREWARFKVRANVVSFGFIETRLTQAKEENGSLGIPEHIRKKSIERIPLNYTAKPIDAAYPILFLASDESKFITGQVLGVNGGAYM